MNKTIANLLEHSLSLTLSMDNFKDISLSELLLLVFSDKFSLPCCTETPDISLPNAHYLGNGILFNAHPYHWIKNDVNEEKNDVEII